jgi:hypothetical protein
MEEGRLRTRPNGGKRPMAVVTPKKRAVQAAGEVLAGRMDRAQAMHEYMVSADQLKWFMRKLIDKGLEDCRTSLSPAFSAPESGYTDLSFDSSTASNHRTSWDDYCAAYIYAGQRVAELGRKRAAIEASSKFKVHISPSTTRRASLRPGEGPHRGGAQLIIPYEVEHKLESLCLALRELNLPIFRYMIMNYVNTLIRGTSIVEKLKHKEVRRHWYYNWLARCSRLKTANIRPLEMSRAQWATPENIKRHYDMLRDKMLELNLAAKQKVTMLSSLMQRK